MNLLFIRKNPYTNRLIKDEFAIMAWETGNELGNPRNNMAKHLVCGGNVDKYLENSE